MGGLIIQLLILKERGEHQKCLWARWLVSVNTFGALQAMRIQRGDFLHPHFVIGCSTKEEPREVNTAAAIFTVNAFCGNRFSQSLIPRGCLSGAAWHEPCVAQSLTQAAF